jgi:hypothetical protein
MRGSACSLSFSACSAAVVALRRARDRAAPQHVVDRDQAVAAQEAQAAS